MQTAIAPAITRHGQLLWWITVKCDMTAGTESIFSPGKFHIAWLMLGNLWSQNISPKMSKCRNFLVSYFTPAAYLTDYSEIWQNGVHHSFLSYGSGITAAGVTLPSKWFILCYYTNDLFDRFQCTPCSVKVATLFSTITLAPFGGFL